MMKRVSLKALALAAGAALALTSGAASAHRQWLLPSSTVLSGDESWVTFDAASSNDLFYFDHNAMRLDNVKATAPDGADVPLENKATGRYRSTFDVHLTKPGTYRVANVTNGLMGSYMLNGERKRLPRGTTAATLKSAIPAGATDVQTAQLSNRNEVYVTLGAPTATLFKPTGEGLEMVPVTHPNDLVAGETATFQFLLDGKPAANLNVIVIPGGIRYRDAPNQMNLTTGADGKVAVKWDAPGMYWLNASTGGRRAEGGPGQSGGDEDDHDAAPAARPAPGADGPAPRRAGYSTTLEVLAP